MSEKLYYDFSEVDIPKDYKAECDWGDCDEPAVGFRCDVEGHGWLPVCEKHRP